MGKWALSGERKAVSFQWFLFKKGDFLKAHSMVFVGGDWEGLGEWVEMGGKAKRDRKFTPDLTVFLIEEGLNYRYFAGKVNPLKVCAKFIAKFALNFKAKRFALPSPAPVRF